MTIQEFLTIGIVAMLTITFYYAGLTYLEYRAFCRRCAARRKELGILLIGLLLAHTAPTQAAGRLSVQGNPAFKAVIGSALAVLQTRDGADYAYVTDGYVKNIIEWNGGYSFADLTPGYHDIYISDSQVAYKTDTAIWVAGIIVHERTHFWDYTHGINPYDEKPPILRQAAAYRAMGNSAFADYVTSFIR